MKIWIDGRVVEGHEARVPVLDHGFLYGDGIFESFRVHHGRLFRLDAHLKRLATSARAVGLEIPGGLAAVEAIVRETVRAHGRDDAYVRLLLSRGEGALGVDPTLCKSPRVVCIVDELAIYPAEKLARGIDLVTVSVRRPAPDALDPRVKSLNYLNNVLAKGEARSRGADEALLLGATGAVAEASVANVFAVCDGGLQTPLASDGALAGITRAAILELAPRLGIAAEARTLGRFDLLGADEIFLTGTGAGVVPVGSLDGQPFAPLPGPVTLRIDAAFAELMASEGSPV